MISGQIDNLDWRVRMLAGALEQTANDVSVIRERNKIKDNVEMERLLRQNGLMKEEDEISTNEVKLTERK